MCRLFRQGGRHRGAAAVILGETMGRAESLRPNPALAGASASLGKE
jgi:hypothetical protein